MLGRLVKHEWKDSLRLLLPINILGLVVAGVGGIVFYFLSAQAPMLSIGVFFVMISILFFVGLSFGTTFLIAMQYYNSLYTDEGYLTLTLPVKRKQLLCAKIIVGSIWFFINEMVVLVGIGVWIRPFFSPSDWKEMMSLPVISDISTLVLIAGFILLLILGALTSVLMVYGCISIGQFFSNHRILGAIGAYVVISAVVQVVTMSAMSIFGAAEWVNNASGGIWGTLGIREYLIITFCISLVGCVLECVIGYVLSIHILEKNVNLY